MTSKENCQFVLYIFCFLCCHVNHISQAYFVIPLHIPKLCVFFFLLSLVIKVLSLLRQIDLGAIHHLLDFLYYILGILVTFHPHIYLFRFIQSKCSLSFQVQQMHIPWNEELITQMAYGANPSNPQNMGSKADDFVI